MRLHDIVAASQSVGETSGRSEKIRLLAECLRRAGPDEIEIAVGLLSGEPRQGRIGIGPAALRAAASAPPAAAPSLTVAEVDAALDRIATTRGAGSAGERGRITRELLGRATGDEQGFLLRTLLGELRQGAVEGLMVEAVAKAADIPVGEVRRAAMVSGALGAVAQAALTEGRPALARMTVELLRPLAPMLAQTADGVGEALERLGEAAFEYKLDGARIQLHKCGSEVRLFTRSLNDVTSAAPEIVETALGLPIASCILDGEAIGFRADGRPQPFQITMRRFGRKLDVPRLRQEIPLRAFFFDCLYVDGAALIDQPGSERFAALARAVPGPLLVQRRVTRDAAVAETFLQEALAAGHEGVMAKALDAPYEAGARGRGWLKIKPAITLDLVVLAVERGNGRRSRWLSNLHLGARDPATGGFVMLGKTFKGMTDEMLAWQTEELRKLATADDGYTVTVAPQLVVEIAFNDIQASPRYPGGLALRFARVKAYRPDKRAEDADTIDTVRSIYERQTSGDAKTAPS
ncbi:MAG TPA: ATP-dependent DNA ligase [Stellaceae bacterium]|nr:ATP-dependent DNA ligase [Stellaceae bacterium]